MELPAAQISEPKKTKRIYFQNTSQALRAAMSGVGIMVTHKPLILDEIQASQLKQITDIKVQLSESYYLVCPEDKLKLKKVSPFIQWLANEAKKVRQLLREL